MKFTPVRAKKVPVMITEDARDLARKIAAHYEMPMYDVIALALENEWESSVNGRRERGSVERWKAEVLKRRREIMKRFDVPIATVDPDIVAAIMLTHGMKHGLTTPPQYDDAFFALLADLNNKDSIDEK